jgi:hypothetical protein
MLHLALKGGLPLVFALAVLVLPTYALAAPAPRTILIHDECDQSSFNAAIGPGTCTRNGGVPFSTFINQFNRLQQVPEWHFTPDKVQLKPGEAFVATNVGGELHSFTEVAAFGGGVVPTLNTFAGATRPECAAAFSAFLGGAGPSSSFVRPGQSTPPDVPSGTELYQCCIHPWMHAVISVKP